MTINQPQAQNGAVATNFQPMTFIGVKPSEIGPNWYMTDLFEGAELVTDASSNPLLGITNISLFPHNDPNRPGTVGRASIEFLNGVVSTGGWINQTEGGLRFNVYQASYKDANGETKYSDPVRINKLVAAQVLRYATKRMVPLTQEAYAAFIQSKNQQSGFTNQQTGFTQQSPVVAQGPAVTQNSVAPQADFDPFAVASGPVPF